ncbi:MAG: hypothetical protein Q7T87_03530 [Polaromonas sp.]|nr:hypothetical protein [Polaromonas sp.]
MEGLYPEVVGFVVKNIAGVVEMLLHPTVQAELVEALLAYGKFFSVRAEPVEACLFVDAVPTASKPGVAWRQLTFFLLRQKESKQRIRRPDGLGPFAALRATCGARSKRGQKQLACGSDKFLP